MSENTKEFEELIKDMGYSIYQDTITSEYQDSIVSDMWELWQRQQAEITRLKDANAKMIEALERIDEWLKVRHLGGLMPAEKQALAKAKELG